MKKKNKKALSVDFEKIQGTENDFIFIDARHADLNKKLKRLGFSSRKAFVKKMSHRTQGVGADGVVFVEQKNALIKWDFYNSDGSWAEMCGNAARCMAHWVFEKKLAQEGFSFLTRQGLVFAEKIKKDHFYVEWLPKNFDVLALKVKGIEAALVYSGVPHIVVWDQRKTLYKNFDLIQELRWHKSAGPRGANVTFAYSAHKKLYSTSYERGVENFTRACGTGAVATALFAHTYKKFPTRATVHVPGGQLKVSLNVNHRRVGLEGPAKLVFEGKIYDSN